jgi:hypothetical protein
MKFVWGIVWIIVGILVMRYNFSIVQLFGKVGWAENHLSGGLGGTYTMYKLLGLLIVILALLYMFNSIDFLVKPFMPLFGLGQ